MGRAINKTVTIAEIIKRRIPNLHQITEISSTDITDVYEPLEEGLDTYVLPSLNFNFVAFSAMRAAPDRCTRFPSNARAALLVCTVRCCRSAVCPLLIVQLTCRIETTRHVSSITIVLSTVPLDTSAPGYQAPLPEDQVKEHVPSAVTSPTAGTVEPPRGMRELDRSF